MQEIRDTNRFPLPSEYYPSSLPPPSSSSRGKNVRFQGDGPSAGSKGEPYGGLRAILRGGWKGYEHEGLWDLDEYEEQRLRSLEAFGTLRNQIAALAPNVTVKTGSHGAQAQTGRSSTEGAGVKA